MICAACQHLQDRGKRLDNAKCAFPGGQPFSPENWNCSTVGMLRDIFSEVIDGVLHERVTLHHVVRGGDTTHVMVDLYEIDGYDLGDLSWKEEEATVRCLWVSWYKSRGRTQAMWLLAHDVDQGDPTPRLPTEADIVLICKVLARDAEWAASPEGIEWRKNLNG